MMNKKLYIGVDPDVSKSGFAFLTTGGKFRLYTIELYKVAELIRKEMKKAGILFFEDIVPLVESPISDSNNFGAEGLFKAKRIQFRNAGFGKYEDKALRLALKIANDKGRCSQIAEEIIKIMISIGIPEGNIQRIKPSDRRRVDKNMLAKVGADQLRNLCKKGKPFRFPSKMDHKRFCELAGVQDKTTNEEKRDAGLLLIQNYLNF